MGRWPTAPVKPLLPGLALEGLADGVAVEGLVGEVVLAVGDVDAFAAAGRTDMRAVVLRPRKSQEDVDAAADNVVAPRLVVVAVPPSRLRGHALIERRPLLVRARAALLRRRAELLDAPSLHLRVRQLQAGRALHPVVQVRDPGVVLFDCAVLVKLPERDLDMTE